MIEVSRSRSRGRRPLGAPERCDQRIGEVIHQGLAELVVGEDAGELDDRAGLRGRQERQEGVAQVVLHLGAAEPWPEVLEQLHELAGHELRLVGRAALEEVEPARVLAVGQAQDVDATGGGGRQAGEDVAREIAVGVDDGHPDGRGREGADEVEQQRALARSRRAEHREMAGEGVGPDGEVATAAGAEDEAGRRGDVRRRSPERAGPGEAGAIEGSVGERPQLRDLPVGEPRRPRMGGAPVDLPLDRLDAVVERAREADQPPQQRLGWHRR